jgi:hypothetical protein
MRDKSSTIAQCKSFPLAGPFALGTLATQVVKERLATMGFDTVPTTADGFAAESVVWGRVVREAEIKSIRSAIGPKPTSTWASENPQSEHSLLFPRGSFVALR